MKFIVKNTLIKRLEIIAGQVRGVKRMLNKKRNCINIAMQMSAAKHALVSFEQVLFENYLNTNIAKREKTKETRALTEIKKIYHLSTR